MVTVCQFLHWVTLAGETSEIRKVVRGWCTLSKRLYVMAYPNLVEENFYQLFLTSRVDYNKFQVEYWKNIILTSAAFSYHFLYYYFKLLLGKTGKYKQLHTIWHSFSKNYALKAEKD